MPPFNNDSGIKQKDMTSNVADFTFKQQKVDNL
jgi:hypothetical protein